MQGSIIGRKAEEGASVMKDLDFNRRIFLCDEARQAFIRQIEADSRVCFCVLLL